MSRTAELRHQGAAASGFYGSSVAISGDTAVVSAPDEYVDGDHKGAAYVFRRTAGNWGQVAILTRTPIVLSQRFGDSVAIDGDTIVIAAPIYEGVGAAYVYREVNGVWTSIATLIADNGAAGDNFATSVAISGNRIIVGATGFDDAAPGYGAAYIFQEINGAWSQVAQLTNATEPLYGLFGYDVAIDGGVALVSALYGNGDVYTRGAVFVFDDIDGVWQETGRLARGQSRTYDGFGYSIDLDGDIAVAGIPEERGVIPVEPHISGSVYVFRRSGFNWQEVAKLKRPDNRAYGQFGFSVEVDDGTLIVGAPEITDLVYNCGYAYIFRDFGDDWRPVATLKPEARILDNNFGQAVAIDGQSILIGQAGDTFDYRAGLASVFEFESPCGDCDNNGADDDFDIATGASADCNANVIPDACEMTGDPAIDCDANGAIDECDIEAGLVPDCNGNGVPDACDIAVATSEDCDANGIPDECELAANLATGAIAPSNATASDAFGSSVDIDGDAMIVGAPNRQDSASQAGVSFIYERTSGDWEEVAELRHPAPSSSAHFGAAVAIEANLAIVGAPGAMSNTGVVFVHERVNGLWTPTASLTASDARLGAMFGASVALDDGRIVVGSPRSYENDDAVGAAYVFEKLNGDWTETAKLTPSIRQLNAYFGGSLAISGATIAVGARQEDDGYAAAGVVYLFSYENGQWLESARLTSPSPSRSAQFGTSIALQGATLVVIAPSDNDFAYANDGAYVFENVGADWALVASLKKPTEAYRHHFSAGAAIHGDQVVAATTNTYDPFIPVPGGGYTYLYQRFGASWEPISRLRRNASHGNTQKCCAISQSTLVTGDPYANSGVSSGAIYTYDLRLAKGDCDFSGVPDACESLWTVNDFVHALLNASIDPFDVCVFDGDGDGVVDGRDIQAFVTRALAP
ncbi:MAG TPA: hypothetical protein P5081_14295 [Phycisphaerae bacterium]|nr:hypothetical protein [Phycisphaerae bacterium]HRW54040.1 hypothetical protein [Phycisphaerae bacterium]